jgi:ABC-type nitrate/sulfonate/bicarbonate transport system permease component
MSESSTAAAAGKAAARDRKLTFRGGGFVIEQRTWISVVAFLILVALWQLATGTGLISPIFLPSPMRVLRALWDLAVSGDLWRHVSASLMRIGYGWFIGTVFGICFGLTIGLFTVARAAGLPLVAAIFPIPKIALLPLLILWLGIGEGSKVATIALSVFFPTAIATFSGVDSVPRNLIRMAQSFNVPLWRIVWQVLVPGALPGMLAGFRISIAAALLVLVAAEMIGAQYGIGAFLILTGNMMQTDRLMAGVVVVSVLGLAMSIIVSTLERRLLRWR